MKNKPLAKMNRTLTLTTAERNEYRKRLIRLDHLVTPLEILNTTICQDLMEALPFLPDGFVDLLFLDPPYNLDRRFNRVPFRKKSMDQYAEWMDGWLSRLVPLLKPTASVYICADWRSSPAVHAVASRYFQPRNRITWEREKGRGAARNWKNCLEDIWFFTHSGRYTFNLEAVKMKRRVIAPYTHANGEPKGWVREAGTEFRLTHPSNLWTDITVPFWSMPENTIHPTQKPEKLLAKIILASSNPGDVVLDPFLGSGTASVTAKKLGRYYVGIEIDETYCCLAEERLHLAEREKMIQGYEDGVFWERNTLVERLAKRSRGKGRPSP